MRLLVDATTLLAWLDRPPVGTVRVERMVVADLCRRLSEQELAFVKARHGAFRAITDGQRRAIHRLAEAKPAHPPPDEGKAAGHRGVVRAARKRARRWLEAARPARPDRGQEDAAFEGATDFLTLGHGWEHLDHAKLAVLRQRHGFRIHAFVHDLIAVDHPHFFHEPARAGGLRRHLGELCRLADNLIVNSEATRAALERFIGEAALPHPRLHVARLPSFVTPDSPGAELPAELGDAPFVLYVSTLEIRKNHRLLLRLWSEQARAGTSLPRLVLVGRIGWGVEEALLMLRHDPALAGRVLLLDEVTDETLTALYRRCLFSVYPSYAEGWGMPIAEAMSLGKLCVHADDPAQVEASQGLGPAVDADDYPAWRGHMVSLTADPTRRTMLERQVRACYRSRKVESFCEDIRRILGMP